jgi:phosphopentomutase
MKIKSILILFYLLFSRLCFTQNVILVVFDGARYTESFGADSTFIPHLYNSLKPLGSVYTNFRIADEGRTETNPGHGSILTGTWQQIKNDGSQRPTKPTVFEYFRKENLAEATDCFIVAGKKKLEIFSYSTIPDYGSAFSATVKCFNGCDNDVYDSLVVVMDTYHPRLIMVNLPDTDLKGHGNNWKGYLNAITHADSIIYQLWQKIQSDSFYQNNTTMFVTDDHGRHDDAHGGFCNHGDDCEGCEHIMLLAIGRNVPQGLINDETHYQIDLAATIGGLLGFSTPLAEGKSLY